MSGRAADLSSGYGRGPPRGAGAGEPLFARVDYYFATARDVLVKTTRILLAIGVVATGVYGVIAYEGQGTPADDAARAAAAFGVLAPSPWQLDTVRVRDEDALFIDAARRAWSYIDHHYEPATGFVWTVPDYPITTLWDVASGLAALYCAEALGLLEPEQYEARTARALLTLRSMPLFDGAAFNKAYLVDDARMADRTGAASARGYGWSAMDLGRLLVWLRIIALEHPRFAADAAAVVERLDVPRIVSDGYLHGAEFGTRGARIFQEGRIGYEQYAAEGFALWGHEALRARDILENAGPASILDRPVLHDRRPRGCLTSEPYLLTGLELGWDAQSYRLALSVLAAQRERYARTGQVTLVSEDASSDAPHYFYYYCALFEDQAFGVTAQGEGLLADGPRTISTKAAFAWYALSPNRYTREALELVTGALAHAEGWPAGLREGSNTVAGPENVNTAAVILESALFARRGRPILPPRAAAAPASQPN